MNTSRIRRKKIFLTGGAGFIGSHLVESLIENNQIIIYDNFHRDALKHTRFWRHPNLKIIKGDILDPRLIADSIDACEIVFHLAAIAGIENVTISPFDTLKINLMGTYNLLRAINGRSRRIQKFVFFSTSEVYGQYVSRAKESGMTTQGQVKEQRWAYATSKIAGEHWVYAYFKKYCLPAVIIRPFNIYGPRQVGEGAIHNFIVKAILNQPLEIYSSGEEIRSWCYIDDFIEGLFLATTSQKSTGQVYNLGNPEATLTVLELAKLIIKTANSRSKIVFRKRNYPDVALRVPSIDLVKKELNYQPKFDLEKGLKVTIDWYKKISKKELN